MGYTNRIAGGGRGGRIVFVIFDVVDVVVVVIIVGNGSDDGDNICPDCRRRPPPPDHRRHFRSLLCRCHPPSHTPLSLHFPPIFIRRGGGGGGIPVYRGTPIEYGVHVRE